MSTGCFLHFLQQQRALVVTGIAALALFKAFSHLREESKQEVGLYTFPVVVEDPLQHITTEGNSLWTPELLLIY